MTMTTIANTTISMTSFEIAELTGKRHDNVMADIRKMFKELEIDAPDFSGTQTYGNNNTRTIFTLDKDLTMTLVSGYNAKLRMAIIKRVNELEAENQMMGQALVEVTQSETLTEAHELAQRCLAKREFLRNTYKGEFTEVITESFQNRTSEGGRNVGQAIGNHAKLISLVATGMTPCVFKKHHDGMNARDYAMHTMDEALLESLNRVEGKVVALSMAGFSYTDIKNFLIKD